MHPPTSIMPGGVGRASPNVKYVLTMMAFTFSMDSGMDAFSLSKYLSIISWALNL